MKKLHDILIHLFSVLVMAVFLFTSSGFTLYKHFCDHDGKRVSLTVIDDCCGDDEIIVDTDCCEEVPKDTPDDDESACCQDDRTFFKLDNSYLQTENQKDKIACDLQPARVLEWVDQEEGCAENPEFTSRKKKHDQQAYRLYHRVKTGPPLT